MKLHGKVWSRHVDVTRGKDWRGAEIAKKRVEGSWHSTESLIREQEWSGLE
jgi:hypothetical protein